MPNIAKLIDSVVSPTRILNDYLVITALDNGRWAISKDLVLLDTTTMQRYIPGTTDKAKLHYKEIPGLVTGDETIYANYLLALALKPLYLSREILLSPTKRPALHIRQGTWTGRAEQVFWQYPKGGIRFDDVTPLLYVPYLPNVFADPAGGIFRKIDNEFVKITPDVEGTDILYLTWPGNVTPVTLSASRLMMFAHGEYSASDLVPNIYHRDGKDGNYARDNLVTKPEDVPSHAVEGLVDMVIL